jgi:hypothetical protein
MKAPLYKSVRIEPGGDRYFVVIGVGAEKRTLDSATSPAEATKLVREHRKREEAIDAEVRGSTWLADGNAAAEAGNKAKAEKCYDKAQFWLDRYNKLTGRD